MAYLEEKQAQAKKLLGRRIEIPVHYDAWMRGARFGKVTSIGPGAEFVRVHMDDPRIRKRVKLWRVDFNYCRIVVEEHARLV